MIIYTHLVRLRASSLMVSNRRCRRCRTRRRRRCHHHHTLLTRHLNVALITELALRPPRLRPTSSQKQMTISMLRGRVGCAREGALRVGPIMSHRPSPEGCCAVSGTTTLRTTKDIEPTEQTLQVY